MSELWCYLEAFGVLFGPILGMTAAVLLGTGICFGIGFGVTKLTSRSKAAANVVSVVGYFLLYGFLVAGLYGIGYGIYHTKDKICGMGYRQAIKAIWTEK